MAKPILRPRQYTMRDIYEAYAQKLLAAHPEWWGKYEKRVKRKNCYIYSKEEGKVVERMSWFTWKEVIERYFHSAKEAIINGETLRLGANLGKIRGARIQRDFTKPLVNWHETFTTGLKNADGSLIKIYHTEDDYCRIEWVKFGMIPNETSYHFQPAAKNTITKKGFKAEFSRALTEDPQLKFRFKYYPIIKREFKPCNTPTPASGMLSET